MNHAKIAAALHALADAFVADVEAVEQAVTGKKGKTKPVVADAAAAPAAAAAIPAQEAAPAAEPASVAPTVTIAQVNANVLKVAKVNRDRAVAILGSFGLANTVGLDPSKWQAVYDAFEEEIAKQDAAAVQVAQASLV